MPIFHRGSLVLPSDLPSGSNSPLTVFFTADHDPPRNMESSVAELSTLTFTNADDVSPLFSPSIHHYFFRTGDDNTTIAATASTGSHITLVRNGDTETAGSSLNENIHVFTGEEEIQLVVTAPDRMTQATYRILLIRL